MRYTVLTSRTFHHRITKPLSVLVGAALVATLGLPGVAQAQVPSPPTVKHVDDPDSFMVTSVHGINLEGHTFWGLEYDSPSASAKQIAIMGSGGANADFRDDVLTNRAEGKWTFRLRSFKGCIGPCDLNDNGATDDDGETDITADTKGAIRVPSIPVNSAGDYVVIVDTAGSWSVKTTYTHGAPPMPQSFTYVSRPGADTHIFSWTDASKGDKGIEDYTLRWSYGDPALLATEWEMEEGIGNTGIYTLDSDQTAKLMDMKMYTFELRAIGMSSSTVKGDPESDPATAMVPIGMIPTPTLPELAALFLALLLLGSGAYLLRGRQLTGLTRA